ncbi:MAG: aminotransferase, partial [Ignavibacteria bacterium]
FTLDLAAVKAICDRHDALLSVDAIQGLGARQLDVNKVSVDFLSSGVQKWQLGPQGVGIMYVSTKVQDLIRQSHVGWISVQNAWDFFDYVLDLQEDARRYENGTFNAVGISGYHGALSFFEQIGFDEAERRVREITTYTFERAMELGFDVVTPAEEALRAGIVTFRHPQAEEVQKHLQQRKMVVSARVGHVRVSPHFYNLREEVDAVLSSVKEFQLA